MRLEGRGEGSGILNLEMLFGREDKPATCLILSLLKEEPGGFDEAVRIPICWAELGVFTNNSRCLEDNKGTYPSKGDLYRWPDF